MSNKEKKMWL